MTEVAFIGTKSYLAIFLPSRSTRVSGRSHSLPSTNTGQLLSTMVVPPSCPSEYGEAPSPQSQQWDDCSNALARVSLFVRRKHGHRLLNRLCSYPPKNSDFSIWVFVFKPPVQIQAGGHGLISRGAEAPKAYGTDRCSRSPQYDDCSEPLAASLFDHKRSRHRIANSPYKMTLHEKSA